MPHGCKDDLTARKRERLKSISFHHEGGVRRVFHDGMRLHHGCQEGRRHEREPNFLQHRVQFTPASRSVTLRPRQHRQKSVRLCYAKDVAGEDLTQQRRCKPQETTRVQGLQGRGGGGGDMLLPAGRCGGSCQGRFLKNIGQGLLQLGAEAVGTV